MLLVSKYTAIKRLIHGYLVATLSIYTKDQNLSFSEIEEIPLYKTRENCKVLYISGVALKLSKVFKCDISIICSQIVSHFSVNYSENYQVGVVSPGWIHIRVSDAIASTCLQSIIDTGSEQKNSIISIPNLSEKLFIAQYAHARCCSLLQLAVREGFKQPQQIPWLDDNRMCLTHPACQNLIGELIQVVDQLVCCSNLDLRYYEKSCVALSKAFDSFWSQCSIWGERQQPKSAQLIQAKLGLVMATQLILKYLLEEKLTIYAPQEL
ncbi:DALR anticodon-binding domain-containing protein [Calothrix sp. PCC 6303]|uniref:DALR anticodon-binding domain-containing protein n=1 Tax=Calothrix sp. PCC 6303 TaxID=1170562 RepID=UPI0005A1D7CF|nr:DALR anticodon-binding domain-containing protein [Calothrix sp. PCC 6303]